MSSEMYACHGFAYGFLVSHDKCMPSVECREDCETSENYQLNVARHAFSCSMRFRSHLIHPFGVRACALCRRRIKFLDASVLSDCQVFQHGHRVGWVSLAPSFFVCGSRLDTLLSVLL